MKKSISLFVFLAAILIASTGFGQGRKFEVMVGGGIDSPVKPDEFNDGFNLGLTGKLSAGYFLAPQPTVGTILTHNRFGLERDYFLLDTPIAGAKVSGGDLSVYEIAGVANITSRPAHTTNFYIMGGPGLALSKVSDLKVTTTHGDFSEQFDTESNFLLTGGIGITHRLNSCWDLFVEGRYSYLFTEDENSSYLPVRIGLIL